MEENFNSKKRKQSGLVRVGKLKWDFNKKRDIIPKVEGFVPVIIKNYKYGLGHTLSPYFLKDENGCIMENVWQVRLTIRDIIPVPIGVLVLQSLSKNLHVS